MYRPIKILLLSMLLIAGFAISCQQKPSSNDVVEPTKADAIQLEKQMWKAMADSNMNGWKIILPAIFSQFTPMAREADRKSWS